MVKVFQCLAKVAKFRQIWSHCNDVSHAQIIKVGRSLGSRSMISDKTNSGTFPSSTWFTVKIFWP